MNRLIAAVVVGAAVIFAGTGTVAAAQLHSGEMRTTPHITDLPGWLPHTEQAKAYVNRAASPVPNEVAIGSPISSKDVTAIVKDGSELWFGLATLPNVGQTYPALSSDGGTAWKIDGPLFHFDAAQAASSVASGGALAPDGAYFWGSGGNVIWITYDSGVHWQTVGFGAGVDRVTSPRKDTLDAIVFGNEVKQATALQRFLYVTTDSGMTWSVRERLPNLRLAG